MKQISILGCGWLGFPLAKALIEKGFDVKGSTTSPEKLDLLKNGGIDAFVIVVNSDKIEGNIEAFLDKSEILIIDIPPKLRNPENDPSTALRNNPSTALRKLFVERIKNLEPFIENSSIKKVLFVSSTSVYADAFPIPTYTENSIENPETESGKQLLEAEKLLLSNPNFKTVALRFAGLIGENRHPIKSLSGKINIENPDAPINLIHQDDCIGIIQKIICHTEPDEVWNETFNAVTPFHPSRKEYYCQKAISSNLALPEFNDSATSIGKTISSEKLIRVLGYDFKIPGL